MSPSMRVLRQQRAASRQRLLWVLVYTSKVRTTGARPAAQPSSSRRFQDPSQEHTGLIPGKHSASARDCDLREGSRPAPSNARTPRPGLGSECRRLPRRHSVTGGELRRS